MNRIINILNKEFNNINQAAFILAFFAFLSQVLAIFRDRSLAHFFGPSAGLDVYYAAFRVPDFIFVSVASLAAVTALLPFLVEKLKGSENGTPQARAFFNDVFTLFLGAMVLISIIAFFLMPILAPLIAPGFSEDLQKRTYYALENYSSLANSSRSFQFSRLSHTTLQKILRLCFIACVL